MCVRARIAHVACGMTVFDDDKRMPNLRVFALAQNHILHLWFELIFFKCIISRNYKLFPNLFMLILVFLVYIVKYCAGALQHFNLSCYSEAIAFLHTRHLTLEQSTNW